MYKEPKETTKLIESGAIFGIGEFLLVSYLYVFLNNGCPNVKCYLLVSLLDDPSFKLMINRKYKLTQLEIVFARFLSSINICIWLI